MVLIVVQSLINKPLNWVMPLGETQWYIIQNFHPEPPGRILQMKHPLCDNGHIGCTSEEEREEEEREEKGWLNCLKGVYLLHILKFWKRTKEKN